MKASLCTLLGALSVLGFQWSVHAAQPSLQEEEILYRLRPSELAGSREVQAAFHMGPLILFNLGPSVAWGGRLQTPYRVYFGAEMHHTPNSEPTQALLGEVGLSFARERGGPWVGALAGVTYTWLRNSTPAGLQSAFKFRAGWDLMLGRHVSLGLMLGTSFLQAAGNKQSPGEDGINFPIEVALPIRIWI